MLGHCLHNHETPVLVCNAHDVHVGSIQTACCRIELHQHCIAMVMHGSVMSDVILHGTCTESCNVMKQAWRSC